MISPVIFPFMDTLHRLLRHSTVVLVYILMTVASLGLSYLLRFEFAPPAETLRQLRAGGICCVAAHPHTDQATLWDLDLTGDLCLVLGSEGNGIRPEVLAACDTAAVIPMHAGVDSLNVAAASAVCFAEVQRQRSRRWDSPRL